MLKLPGVANANDLKTLPLSYAENYGAALGRVRERDTVCHVCCGKSVLASFAST